MEEKKDYQDAYEKEHYKAVYLANRVAELEDQVDDLQFKLNRIKNNPIWKASGPARKCMHFVIRQKDRLKNCGSLSGVIAKVRYKSWEKKAMTHYGTQSFPSAEERQKQEAAVFERMPKISILVPLWNTPESFLTEMIGSVQWQTYKNWELCLADGSDDAHAYVGEYCKRLAAQDSRIVYQKLAKNEGISGNTNECYKLASGEFIGLFDHDDILHPCALYEYVKAINEKDADFIYCDEATFKSPDINKMITMHFKPDYAIDNLRANNYICHFSVFSRELLDGTELFRTKFDGSQDHDMILRLTDNAKHIVHVPKLLYYWRSHAGSVAGNIEAKPYVVEAARGAVADHLRRHGFKNFTITSTRAFETILAMEQYSNGMVYASQAATEAFKTDQLAFLCAGPWTEPDYQQAGVKYEIQLIPAYEEGGWTGGCEGQDWMYGVDSGDEGRNDAIRRWLKKMGDYETQKEFTGVIGRSTLREDVMHDPEALELDVAKKLSQGLECGMYQMDFGHSSVFWVSAITDVAPLVTSGELTPEEAAQKYVDAINALYAEAGE